MDYSTSTMLSRDTRHVLLKDFKTQQKTHKEGSRQWYWYQERIDQLVAQNYLEYINT